MLTTGGGKEKSELVKFINRRTSWSAISILGGDG